MDRGDAHSWAGSNPTDCAKRSNSERELKRCLVLESCKMTKVYLPGFFTHN